MITTPFSFVASTSVLLFEGAVAVFVDVDPITGNIDPQQTAQAAEDLVAGETAARRWLPRQGGGLLGCLKALLQVDVFGQPADFGPLLDVTRRFRSRIRAKRWERPIKAAWLAAWAIMACTLFTPTNKSPPVKGQ